MKTIYKRIIILGIPSYNCILNKTTISMIKDICRRDIFFKFESPIEKLKI